MTNLTILADDAMDIPELKHGQLITRRRGAVVQCAIGTFFAEELAEIMQAASGDFSKITVIQVGEPETFVIGIVAFEHAAPSDRLESDMHALNANAYKLYSKNRG